MNNLALNAFERIAPDHVGKLLTVSGFLTQNPELAPKPARGDVFGSEAYWGRIAEKFLRGRVPKSPSEPSTVPDVMVSVILQEYFGLDSFVLEKVVREHSLAMASENIVGDLLERYIASELEAFGWVWCSGEVVKKVDFLAIRKGTASEVIPIQVKNRDNSENSSSSSVRDGTEIVKWFRTFSRTGATNWQSFPEGIDNLSLSEDDFQKFARDYLRSLKS